MGSWRLDIVYKIRVELSYVAGKETLAEDFALGKVDMRTPPRGEMVNEIRVDEGWPSMIGLQISAMNPSSRDTVKHSKTSISSLVHWSLSDLPVLCR